MKHLLLICGFLTLSLTGCAIARETYLADGTRGYSISCDGAAVGINTCFEKAGELCASRGYTLLGREGQVIPMAVGNAQSSGNYSQYQSQAFVTYGSFNTKSIMIRCGT